MTVRTTSAQVQAILLSDFGETIYGETPDLTPFMETASLMVDDISTCASDKGLTLDDTRAEMIERWLSAHFYAQSDQTYSSKSTGGASGSFQGQTAMYLEGTKYGQAALRLDNTGCLAAVGGKERQVASLQWIGKRPSEQTPYYLRD